MVRSHRFGKVVAKHHYDYDAMRPAPVTKFNAVLYEGPTELAQAPPITDRWSVTAEGVDKHGKPLTKEVYVDEMTYNATEVGDAWPNVSHPSASAS